MLTITSLRLIHITTLLLTISQIMLATIFVIVNTDFQIVTNSAATWMSVGELIAASWTDRWGSYHLWTWFTWISVSLIFLKFNPMKKDQDKITKNNAIFFELILWGAIIILFLLMGQRPYRGALPGSSPNGLSPALLSIWNFVHPPLAFASYTGFFLSWAIGSYFWIKSPNFQTKFSQELIKLDRLITRVTWVLTSLVLTLGVLWSHEANWGGYWSWDGVVIISIILWLVSGYRLHLHEIGRNQPLYLFLGIIGLPLVFFAAWVITSNILTGLHSYAGSPVAPLFLTLIFISLVPVLIGWYFNKWKPLSPVKVSNDIAKPIGFNIGVLSFNFLLLGNFSLILLQISNSIFELNRNFENSYPLVNGIGFFGITIGLLYDSLQHKHTSSKLILGILIISSIFSYIFWIQHLDLDFTKLSILAEVIFTISFPLVIIFTIFLLISSEINKYRLKNIITPRRLISHIAMLLVFLTIIANGSGPAVETRVSTDPYILEIGESITTPDGLSVKLDAIEGPINNSRGLIVFVYLSMSKEDQSYTRMIQEIDQDGTEFSYIQSTWITYPNGKEIFFNLQRGDPLRIRANTIIGIHLIVEEYFMTQFIWLGTILFAIIPVIPTKVNPRN
ncbi:MAG: Cytochrome c-type biogenesis protein CcmF [Candidatus Heimdallarchaeota archaeon LC_2]|nr:MAG: Cytochrome c-type biogenesis protein CcmF [Candidatus Heimdallarchaeota archaeon LC_2]